MTAADRPGGRGDALPLAQHARVADAMRHGLVQCSADDSLRDAARAMATAHVHMLVVTSPQDRSVVGTLTDMSLLEGLLDDEAATQALADWIEPDAQSVSSDASLYEAARRMRDLGIAHLLVCDAHSGQPVGVLSTLDVAGILAGSEG